MAPAAPTPEETAKFTESFARISLEGVKAKEALKNAKQARAIEDCITSLDLGPLDQKTLTLFLAACAPGIGADLPDEKRRYVVKRIIDGSLSSADRVSGESCARCCICCEEAGAHHAYTCTPQSLASTLPSLMEW